MRIRYFSDTDTLFIELREVAVAESRDVGEDVLLELDDAGGLCAITVEHASARAGSPGFSYEVIGAA